MRQLQHIFFDNDGTIVDSEILAVNAMLEALAPHGFDMSREEYTRRFPGLLDREIIAIIQQEYPITLPADFVPRLHEQHRDLFEHHLHPIAGMDTLFRQLRTPRSMVSNGSVEHVMRCLRRVGLTEYLDGQIFSGHDVPRPKPFPDVYEHALQAFNLHADATVVIEDSPTGVKAARAAGIRVIGFLGASHIASGHADALIATGATWIAEDAEAVTAILVELGAIVV
jgi:HAD superfamily hydrolase (TIGR01509 family)